MLTVAQVMQRAIAAFQRGEWPEAERWSRIALKKKNDLFDALHILGIITAHTRRPQEASELLSRAVTANPRDATAHGNLGCVFLELGRSEDALQSFDRAITLKPELAEAHNNRGNALRNLKRLAEALQSFERAIVCKPDSAEAHYNRGYVLLELRRPAEALQGFEQAIALKPDYVDAYRNRGNALCDLARPADALRSYERAIALNPDSAEAHYNRGNALWNLKRSDEALQSYERAIALKPNYAEAHNNRGVALGGLSRPDEARESYERAIALKPDYQPAHYNLATCSLLLGDFTRGWQEYEWRWKRNACEQWRRDFAQPLWLGELPLKGKTILLHSEQGLGDTLQFCRYAEKVAALGAHVVLEVPPPLVRLLANLEGVAQVLPEGGPFPAFDYHCPLLSLPLAFRTDHHSIPASVPYVRSDPARVAAWHQTLGSGTKPRIGVVWSGSTGFEYDNYRSMALADLLPLVCDWAEWITLQKEVCDADRALLASRPEIRHMGDELQDFADTAALVELVDLVLTVDTSVAHLAGAMGKTVWVLLSNPNDWRWLLDREDSPWYPTARLFRQPANGGWTSVISRLGEELQRQFRAAPC